MGKPSLDHLVRVVPGVLLCILVTAAATVLQLLETRALGQPYLEALVLAILLGVLIRTVWVPGPFWHRGISALGSKRQSNNRVLDAGGPNKTTLRERRIRQIPISNV